jgi:hypothetical protein
VDEINEGDLVRVRDGDGTVLKVVRFHYMRIPALSEIDRTILAECLLPPHDNANRFENHPRQHLEKVKARKAKVIDPPADDPK